MTEAAHPNLHPFNPKSRREAWIPASYRPEDWPIFPSAPVGNGLQAATVSHLYRFYDEDRQLLYIGVTTNPTNRWPNHMSSVWWRRARYVSLHPIDPARRIMIEQNAIRAERPRYNVAVYTPQKTVIEFHRGMADVVDQFRRRMGPDDFAALVETFKAELDGAS